MKEPVKNRVMITIGKNEHSFLFELYPMLQFWQCKIFKLKNYLKQK